MSDDLAQRLRDWLCPAVISEGLVGHAKMCTELHRIAAKRIEALEARIKELEAQLETAWDDANPDLKIGPYG